MMRNHDTSIDIKVFSVGLVTGVILTHIAYFFFYTHSIGMDGMKIAGEALALVLPVIFGFISATIILLVATVAVILFLKSKSAKSVIVCAQVKADMILRAADMRLAETSDRHRELELIENTLKQTYADKTDKWLEELKNLQRKNQELSSTIAYLKAALRKKKKSHYRNIAHSVAAAKASPQPSETRINDVDNRLSC